MSATTARLSGLFGWFGLGTPASDVLPVRLGATGAAPVQAKGFDQHLVWVTAALLLWGLVMVYSASIAMPDNPRFALYTHTYFLSRQRLLSRAISRS